MENIEEKGGVLYINKEKTWTSFDVVKKIRNMSGVKKVGHSGTLDPLATGVLIIAVSKKYTRQLEGLLKQDKSYDAEIKLGFTTESLDAEKEEEFISDYQPSLEEVEAVLEKFTGKLMQRPPIFSAIKINGQRLYALARKGKTEDDIEIPEREVQIYKNVLLEYNYPILKIRSDVASGTYIRSLVRDIGEELKTGAYLANLSRITLGNVKIEDCVKISELNENNWDGFLHGVE